MFQNLWEHIIVVGNNKIKVHIILEFKCYLFNTKYFEDNLHMVNHTWRKSLKKIPLYHCSVKVIGLQHNISVKLKVRKADLFPF